jgi:hypothetical protein
LDSRSPTFSARSLVNVTVEEIEELRSELDPGGLTDQAGALLQHEILILATPAASVIQ